MKRTLIISTAIALVFASAAVAQRRGGVEFAPPPPAPAVTTPAPIPVPETPVAVPATPAPAVTAPLPTPAPIPPVAAPAAAPAVPVNETAFEKRVREAREAKEAEDRLAQYNALIADRVSIGALTADEAKALERKNVEMPDILKMRELRNREITAWKTHPSVVSADKVLSSTRDQSLIALRGKIGERGFMTAAEAETINKPRPAAEAVPAPTAQSAARAATATSRPAPQAAAVPAQPTVITGRMTRLIDSATLEIEGKRVEIGGLVPGLPASDRMIEFVMRNGPFNCERRAFGYACETRQGDDLAEVALGSGWARVATNAPAKLRDAEQFARTNRSGIWR